MVVITGGPGTGKTTIIKCILSLLPGDDEVALCAPTGRAAKRMSEATGAEARAHHRLLKFGGEDGDEFGHNEDNPLEVEALICDEMSMVDIMLMRSLLHAVVDGTRLVLVGDARSTALGRAGLCAQGYTGQRRCAQRAADRNPSPERKQHDYTGRAQHQRWRNACAEQAKGR